MFQDPPKRKPTPAQLTAPTPVITSVSANLVTVTHPDRDIDNRRPPLECIVSKGLITYPPISTITRLTIDDAYFHLRALARLIEIAESQLNPSKDPLSDED